MKKCWLFILITAFFQANSQQAPPVISSQRITGGASTDIIMDMKNTLDGGVIRCGYTGSNDGDVSNNHGLQDGWLIKYDAAGNTQWKKTYGGSGTDNLVAVTEIPGNGFIATGTTNSNDGDVSGLHGGVDIWLIRVDNNGNLLWQVCYGGARNEFAGSLNTTTTGNILICGNTQSDDGDVIDHHFNVSGLGDCWLIYANASGNLIWTHSYGGSSGETPGYCKQSSDGNLILTCFTSSNDQDVSGNNNGDAWLVKINILNGSIIWQKCFGGSLAETPFALLQVGNNYIIGGITLSTDSYLASHGLIDAYIIKTDLGGNLIWQRTYGGTNEDYLQNLIPGADGGYYAAGYSKSANGNLCLNKGENDYWLFHIDSDGNLLWQKTAGGTKDDRAYTSIQRSDGSIWVDGFSASSDGDLTSNYGNEDSWLLKFAFTGTLTAAGVQIQTGSAANCPGKNITFTASSTNGGTSPLYHWYVNGSEQSGMTSNIFSSTTLLNGDQVSCRMISSIVCIDIPEALSNIITVTMGSGVPGNFLPAILYKCDNLPLDLVPNGSFASYLWNTGDITRTLTISATGNYWLEVTDANGCKGKSFTNVTAENCTNGFYVPKAFTPNDNGKNDLFYPIVKGQLSQYKFTVFNRWGQIVFQSADPSKGWNGTCDGKKVSSNIFIWMCSYRFSGEKEITEKGTVTLIR